MNYHLTTQSGNVKTGPIPVSTSSATTCPTACPLRNGGCYARGGPLGMHWRAVTEGKRGVTFAEFIEQVRELPLGTLWRHNQAGDLPGTGNRIDGAKLRELTAANRLRRGWTYTHKPMSPANAAAVREANAGGFAVNLPANNLTHADELSALGVGPVVVVLPSDSAPTVYTPAGRKVIVCPAQQREGITCADCGLCARRDRSVIVGFLAHGSARRAAERIACEM